MFVLYYKKFINIKIVFIINKICKLIFKLVFNIELSKNKLRHL